MLNRQAIRLVGRSLPYFRTAYEISQRRWASRKVLQKFNLADIGEGITECEVISWSVKAQSPILAFDPLCEVQSDKASVEITSPYDGIVKEIFVKEGEVAKVGDGLCLIEVDEEVPNETDVVAGSGSSQHQELETAEVDATREPTADTNSVSSASPSSLSEPAYSAPNLHPLDPRASPSATLPSPLLSPNQPSAASILATPSVRHYARQKGISLASLAPGSGKGGRVEKVDIDQFLAQGSSATQPERAVTQVEGTGGDVVVELGRTRYGMWKAMVKSLEIPHFGYTTTLDLTAIHALLPVLNTNIPEHYLPAPPPPSTAAVSPSSLYHAPASLAVDPSARFARLTYLPILLKTLSKAMIAWPIFRASITPSPSPANHATPAPKPTLTIRPHADIALALSTPTGLYTPTLAAADTLSVYALASSVAHLAHLGRQVPCALTPREMPRRGGTLTVSNIGAIGQGESAVPVLVPGGGVAIVAVGRARWMWDVERGDGSGERRLKVGVSWSADHRVVEGAELAAFVECWRGYVEAPERLIAEGV